MLSHLKLIQSVLFFVLTRETFSHMKYALVTSSMVGTPAVACHQEMKTEAHFLANSPGGPSVLDCHRKGTAVHNQNIQPHVNTKGRNYLPNTDTDIIHHKSSVKCEPCSNFEVI